MFSTKETPDFTVVSIDTGDTPIKTELLAKLNPPAVEPQKGVVLEGRAPIWLYGFLIHHYHPTAWVATFDPRLGGAVVVQTHTPNKQVGQIVQITQNENENVVDPPQRTKRKPELEL